MKKIILLILYPILTFANFSVPELTSPVIDQTKKISSLEKEEMEKKIRDLYQNGKGPQISILVIDSLNGESIESVANKIFTSWGLGDKKRDDGVLFMISLNDRKSRIEVGQGLEGSLTDLSTKRILSSLRDFFKSNQYGAGLNSGLDQIIKIVSKPDAVQKPIESNLTKTDRVNIIIYLSSALFFVLMLLFGLRIKNHYDDYKKSKLDSKILDELLANLAKSGNDSITNQEKSIKDEINKIEKTFPSLENKLREELEKKKSSQKFKFENQLNILEDLNEKKENLKNEIKYLNSIIKEAKNDNL